MTCAAPATPTTKRRGRPPKTGRPVLRVVIPKDDSASQATPSAVPRRRPGRPRRSARGTIDKPVYVHNSDSESESSEDDSGSDSDTEIEDLCPLSVAGPSSRTHNDEPPQEDDLWSPFFPPKELPSFEETSVHSDDEVQCEEEAAKSKNGDKAGACEEDTEDWADLMESRSNVSAFVMFNRWEDDPKSLRHLPPTKVSTSLGYMAPEAPTYEPRFIWEIKDLSDILDIDKLVEEDESSSSSSSGFESPSNSRSSTQLSSPVQGLPPTTCTRPLDRVSLNITGAPFRFLSPDDDESSIAASTNAPSTPTESSSGDSFFSEDDYPAHILSSPLISSPSKQKAIPRAAAMRRTASAPPVLGGPQSVPLLRNLVGLILQCPLDGCSANFREEHLGDYDEHFQQHHSSGGLDDRRVQCPCRRWVRMSHIANHIAKTHMDTVGYTCRICNQSRTGVDDIIQHIGVCVRTHKHARTIA